MKLKQILFALLFAVVLFGCDNSSNPTSASEPDNVLVAEETILQLDGPLAINYAPGQSENTSVTPLGMLNYQNSSIVKLEFDYLMITNPGLSGCNFTIFQPNNNVLATGCLPQSNYEYVHYEYVFSEIYLLDQEESFYRLTVQFHCLTLSIKNLKLTKVQ